MAKNKQWETPNRIYTTYRGKTTYIVKPKAFTKKDVQWKGKRKIGGPSIVDTALQLAGQNEEVKAPVGPKLIGVGPDGQVIYGDTRKVDYISDVPYNWPTVDEVSSKISSVEDRIQDAHMRTSKEGTRQDLELVLHHLRIARRYAKKALSL